MHWEAECGLKVASDAFLGKGTGSDVRFIFAFSRRLQKPTLDKRSFPQPFQLPMKRA
jgi:hypothetical protein